MDFHFVREQVAAKQLIIAFVSSSDHLTDIMMKLLSKPSFQHIIDKLHFRSTKPSAYGGIEDKYHQFKIIFICNKLLLCCNYHIVTTSYLYVYIL